MMKANEVSGFDCFMPAKAADCIDQARALASLLLNIDFEKEEVDQKAMHGFTLLILLLDTSLERALSLLHDESKEEHPP
ncbi:hypothetical protein [Aurantivibrio plasticivorans]